MGTRVVLLRHGQSTYNALGLYQGCCDESVLTEAGCQTARQTGVLLSGIKFDAVYTSPLKRAQETTRQALAAMQFGVDPQQIHVVPLLREADLHAWQGLPFEMVREHFAADYRCWKQAPHQFAMEVVQSGVKRPFYPALDLYARLQQFWKEVLPHHRNQTLLVVAHGGTNRAAIATALGISPARYHTIQQSNCALSILHFPTGELSSARLEAVNLIRHAEKALPQPKEGGHGLRLLLIPTQVSQPEQTRQLTSLLQTVPIQFSLSNSCNDRDSPKGDLRQRAQQTLNTILQFHPETVQLQVLRQDFPEIWQQALVQTKRYDPLDSFGNWSGSLPPGGFHSSSRTGLLTTGLVMARPNAIASFLEQTIGLAKGQNWRLQIQPGALSVIHYPGPPHPPILQAMNVPGTFQQNAELKAVTA